MPLAPVIAASLSAGLPTRPKALWVGGVDVLRQPGASGNGFGTLIETVTVTEASWGHVSAMSFTIEDPALSVSVTAGLPVLFMDIARDVPIFAGWIETFATTDQAIGRTIEVLCNGREIALDWAKVASYTAAAGTDGHAAIAGLVAASTGLPDPMNVAFGGSTSTTAAPVSLAAGSPPNTAGFTVTNVTLREAINAALASMSDWWSGLGLAPDLVPVYAATVDMRGGLRVWDLILSGTTAPADWVGLTFSTAGPRYPSGLRHGQTNGARGVLVNGGTVAGSGVEYDGTGLAGPTDIVTDPNSKSAAYRHTLAARYFAGHGAQATGSVMAEDGTGNNVGSVGAEVRVNDTVTITDAQAGLSAFTAPMAQIQKTFLPSGDEVWRVDYGAFVPSGASFLRTMIG